eukprot:403350885
MATKCKQCKTYFNLTNRKPIIINECGCIHCLECVTILLNKNKKRQILCPGCDEIRTLPEELKESIQIIKDLKSLDQLTIICDEHQSKNSSMHCLHCEIPVCKDCKRGKNQGHQLFDLKQSNFKTYTENVKQLFDEYSVSNMIQKLDQYSQNQIQITSSQFKLLISKVSRIFGQLVDEEESKGIDLWLLVWVNLSTSLQLRGNLIMLKCKLLKSIIIVNQTQKIQKLWNQKLH